MVWTVDSGQWIQTRSSLLDSVRAPASMHLFNPIEVPGDSNSLGMRVSVEALSPTLALLAR